MLTITQRIQIRKLNPVISTISPPVKRPNGGFTIVELLIVIVVIGILAAITIIAYNGIQQRARVATLQSDLNGAVKTLGLFNASNGSYPANQISASLRASPGTSYRYTYTASTNSYCVTATNSGVAYTASSTNSAPVVGVCPGDVAPGGSSSGGTVTTLAGSNTSNATPMTYGANAGPSITTPSTTQVGDLTFIVGYVEPANEGTPGASFGSFTLPSGVTLASGFPIETDAAQITTGNDHRMYVWYQYATVAGSTTLAFNNTQSRWWGLATVTTHGGPTSGSPFADTPVTATISRSASGVTTTPSVTLTTAASNSLVFWLHTDWQVATTSYPSGFSDPTNASNSPAIPAIGTRIYSSAGSTGAITVTRSGADNGMAAVLFSMRAP